MYEEKPSLKTYKTKWNPAYKKYYFDLLLFLLSASLF